jgi:hypothetical protein
MAVTGALATTRLDRPIPAGSTFVGRDKGERLALIAVDPQLLTISPGGVPTMREAYRQTPGVPGTDGAIETAYVGPGLLHLAVSLPTSDPSAPTPHPRISSGGRPAGWRWCRFLLRLTRDTFHFGSQ